MRADYAESKTRSTFAYIHYFVQSIVLCYTMTGCTRGYQSLRVGKVAGDRLLQYSSSSRFGNAEVAAG